MGLRPLLARSRRALERGRPGLQKQPLREGQSGAGSQRLAPRRLRVHWGQRRPQVAGPCRRSGSGSGSVSGTSLLSPSSGSLTDLVPGFAFQVCLLLLNILCNTRWGSFCSQKARGCASAPESKNPKCKLRGDKPPYSLAPAPGEGTTESGPSSRPCPSSPAYSSRSLSAHTRSADVSLGAAIRPPRHSPGFGRYYNPTKCAVLGFGPWTGTLRRGLSTAPFPSWLSDCSAYTTTCTGSCSPTPVQCPASPASP